MGAAPGRSEHPALTLADVTAPRIVGRAESGLVAPRMRMAGAPKLRSELFLHHDVLAVGDDPFLDWRQTQAAAFGRGFTDISYTYGAHPDGTILEGRNPGFVGAHTEGYNTTAHAIVLLGNYHQPLASPPPLRPTEAQINAVRWLRLQMVARGELTPGHRFRRHRDVKATACPGSNAAEPIAWWALNLPWQPPAPIPIPPSVGTWTEEMIMALPELSRAKRAEQAADPNRLQQVKNLQGLLQAANRTAAIDGDFGPSTEAALREWQQAAGCQVTGTTTQETWRTLLGA